MQSPITSLKAGSVAKMAAFQGQGSSFQRKLRTMGIREGKILKVIAVYPLAGPIVIDIDGRQITLGRGIARRILVEAEDCCESS